MGESAVIAMLGAIAAGCFLSGVVGGRYPWVTLFALGAIVLTYVGFLVFLGAWAVQCWDCGYETPRYAVAVIQSLVTFALMLVMLMCVGFGTIAWPFLRDFAGRSRHT
ncbi:MAG TPA: hypothetical protein VIH21_05155 [Dehalococcoidia bacterium]|jgi:hypothetical protein